jgi:hypothetical protein
MAYDRMTQNDPKFLYYIYIIFNHKNHFFIPTLLKLSVRFNKEI